MAIRPMLLLTLPVVAVMGYLAAGGLGIVLATACLTAVLAIIPEQVAAPRHGDPVTGLPLRPDLEAAVDGALEKSRREHRNLGVIVVEIDRFKNLVERYDHRLIDALLQTVADRLRGELRDADVLARLDGPSFGIALSPARRLDLEAAIQLIGRLQQAVAEPIPNQGANIYLTISAGFALAERVEKPTGPRLVQAQDVEDRGFTVAGGDGEGAVFDIDMLARHFFAKILTFCAIVMIRLSVVVIALTARS